MSIEHRLPSLLVSNQETLLHAQLLIDRLDDNCAVTASIRQTIEAMWLLSQKALNDRECQGD